MRTKLKEERSREAGQDQRHEMEKVCETEMIQAFHKLTIQLMEMYSPTAEAIQCGLRTGAAVDLTNGWDFRHPTTGKSQ